MFVGIRRRCIKRSLKEALEVRDAWKAMRPSESVMTWWQANRVNAGLQNEHGNTKYTKMKSSTEKYTSVTPVNEDYV